MLRAAPAALVVAAFFLAPSPTATPDVSLPAAPAAAAGLRSGPGTPGGFTLPAAGTYALDPAHTTVGFRIRHMGLAFVEGEFDSFEGTVAFDPANVAATTVTATVQTTSVDTDVDARDGHLRTADFFDVATYPTMTFQSTAVHPTGPNTFRLVGDLTLHGVTRPVTLDVTAAGPISDPRGGTRAGFHAEGEIDRRDFGITWGQNLPSGVPGVGHLVTLVLDAEATAG